MSRFFVETVDKVVEVVDDDENIVLVTGGISIAVILYYSIISKIY